MKKNQRFFINIDGKNTEVNLKELKFYDKEGEPNLNKHDIIIIGKTDHDIGALATLAILRGSLPLPFLYTDGFLPQIKETISYKPARWPITKNEVEQMINMLFPEVKITVQPPFKKIARDSEFKITYIEPIIAEVPKKLIKHRKI